MEEKNKLIIENKLMNWAKKNQFPVKQRKWKLDYIAESVEQEIKIKEKDGKPLSLQEMLIYAVKEGAYHQKFNRDVFTRDVQVPRGVIRYCMDTDYGNSHPYDERSLDNWFREEKLKESYSERLIISIRNEFSEESPKVVESYKQFNYEDDEDEIYNIQISFDTFRKKISRFIFSPGYLENNSQPNFNSLRDAIRILSDDEYSKISLDYFTGEFDEEYAEDEESGEKISRLDYIFKTLNYLVK